MLQPIILGVFHLFKLNQCQINYEHELNYCKRSHVYESKVTWHIMDIYSKLCVIWSLTKKCPWIFIIKNAYGKISVRCMYACTCKDGTMPMQDLMCYTGTILLQGWQHQWKAVLHLCPDACIAQFNNWVAKAMG